MTFLRSDLERHAMEICEAAGLAPDDVYRLVLYAAHPDDTPNHVGPGMLAYVYKRRNGKKYLKDNGEPATKIVRFAYLPELRL